MFVRGRKSGRLWNEQAIGVPATGSSLATSRVSPNRELGEDRVTSKVETSRTLHQLKKTYDRRRKTGFYDVRLGQGGTRGLSNGLQKVAPGDEVKPIALRLWKRIIFVAPAK